MRPWSRSHTIQILQGMLASNFSVAMFRIDTYMVRSALIRTVLRVDGILLGNPLEEPGCRTW
jgi:hypothetical protein